MKRLFSVIFLTALLSTHAEAAKFYRHIPFSMSMKSGDTLVVNYDFTGKNGIRCTANDHTFQVHFTYKGHLKSAPLPTVLQSAHVPERVPEKEREELADVAGQYRISLVKNGDNDKEYDVSCHYVERG